MPLSRLRDADTQDQDEIEIYRRLPALCKTYTPSWFLFRFCLRTAHKLTLFTGKG